MCAHVELVLGPKATEMNHVCVPPAAIHRLFRY